MALKFLAPNNACFSLLYLLWVVVFRGMEGLTSNRWACEHQQEGQLISRVTLPRTRTHVSSHMPTQTHKNENRLYICIRTYCSYPTKTCSNIHFLSHYSTKMKKSQPGDFTREQLPHSDLFGSWQLAYFKWNVMPAGKGSNITPCRHRRHDTSPLLLFPSCQLPIFPAPCLLPFPGFPSLDSTSLAAPSNN